MRCLDCKTTARFTPIPLRISLGLLLASLCACGSEVVDTGAHGSLIWSEEFTGTALDANSWTVENTCTVYNGEQECYTTSPNNVWVSDGGLTLQVLKQRDQNQPYTSGRINTMGKQHWTYGYFESRIKVPCGLGVWPAFWLMPNDSVYGAWPQSGELDIMEIIGREASTTYGTMHFGTATNGSSEQVQGNMVNPTGDYCDDYHIFSMQWDANSVAWSVDGATPYLTVTSDSQDWAPLQHWPFDQSFYIILNLAMGGDWPGSPDPSIQSAQMLVDYVRVYSQP